MGAGHVKRVYRRWGHLPAPAFRLLAYIAVTVPDRDPRPRCEMSRESLAYGLGYTVFDDAADRAVKRAVSSLKVAGALTLAQAHAPGRRAHYWVELSMEQGTDVSPDAEPDTDESGDTSDPCDPQQPSMEQGTHLSGTGDTSVPCEVADTVLPTSGQEHQEEDRTRAGVNPDPAPTPAEPRLRALPGGGQVARKPTTDQPGLWPAAVPDTPAVAASDAPPVTAQTIVGEWIDRCRKRPPRQVIGQVSKHIREMLTEGIDADDIRRGTAHWMAKGLHPAALPSVVNEVMNRGSVPPAAARRSTTDERVAAAIEAGRRLQALADRQAIGS